MFGKLETLHLLVNFSLFIDILDLSRAQWQINLTVFKLNHAPNLLELIPLKSHWKPWSISLSRSNWEFVISATSFYQLYSLPCNQRTFLSKVRFDPLCNPCDLCPSLWMWWGQLLGSRLSCGPYLLFSLSTYLLHVDYLWARPYPFSSVFLLWVFKVVSHQYVLQSCRELCSPGIIVSICNALFLLPAGKPGVWEQKELESLCK